MSSDELLNDLELQAQANRALEQEQREKQAEGVYKNPEEQTTGGKNYVQMGNASVAQGTNLAANFDPNSGEVVWVETFDSGESGSELAEPIKCANGTDCLDSNFCYGWYECDPCEWCEDNTCVPRDENRPCKESWECPCPPNEDQHYECVDDKCLLSCTVNADCGECEVCNLFTGFCGPGCQSDEQCDPLNLDKVGDAQANTFCENCECVYPCDPVRYCNLDTDCFDYEYCGERVYKVASDPTDGSAIRQCIEGCREGSCPEGEECDLENRSCFKPCNTSADCGQDESCEEGKCQSVGLICASSSDCEDGQYCNEDGRCTSGCQTDSDCDIECGKDPQCVDACPPEPNCSCEGEGCYNENWRDLCERDPACVALCPDDEYCARQQRRDSCVSGQCEQRCSDSANCGEGEICVDGLCMLKASDEGDSVDSRIGCDCGDVCNQYGTCEPAICQVDEECPACSICEEGVCIPGCSDENPCPDNGCCNPDGRCAKRCSQDLDCADQEGNQLCLEGGCCGLICEPLIPCVSNSDCQPGQYCAEENYCIDGCFQDSDCDSLVEEGSNKLYRCEKTYVRAPNGVIAPCEFYPNEECFSEVGLCTEYCITSSDCDGEEICTDGRCGIPPIVCANDNDCENGEVCLSGSCSIGCRFDSDCLAEEKCFENGCVLACSSNDVCQAIYGSAGVCTADGVCGQVNEGTSSEGGHRGCECYEFCDKEGYCTPFICDSDLDCEEEACGSCLVGNVCGECFDDSDCPGTKVCDQPLDDEGNVQKDPQTGKELGGTCAYACTPGGPLVCIGTTDCPTGMYCEQGQCQTGCVENGNCRPDQVCRAEQCVSKCTVDSQCGNSELCIEGGCRYVGNPCNRENDEAILIQDQLDYFSARSEENSKIQEQITELQEIREALIAQGAEQIRIDDVDSQIAVAQAKLNPLTEEEQSQQDLLREQLTAAQNKDCPSSQECNGSYCEPKPDECTEDFECTYPAICAPRGPEGQNICYEAPTDESYKAFDPPVIGCESCADICDNGKCKPANCRVAADCACGSCSGAGKCVETCQTDFDCGGGRCVSGECVECITNADCVVQYGQGRVCNQGQCDTPCYTGLSTGDCSFGLNDGDTCQNCPDKCPLDAPCRKVSEVCNVEEVYDVLQERVVAKLTFCEVCARTCITSSDCDDGTICGGFGYCRPTDGRCTYDSDCAEEALQSGKDLFCKNNTCIERGETCFTNSDCDLGEICDSGTCVVGECGSDDFCQAGQTCVDNECRWQCGSGADVFLCGDAGGCPPGFYCSAEESIGGYCLRPGVSLSDIQNPECTHGNICVDGGCVPITSERNCGSSDDCYGSQQCCNGLCKNSCDSSTSTTPGDSDNEGKTEQDNCQLQGLCCGADGFCEPCGCDEKNPCGEGQCCDRDSQQCISITEHPNTKYGSPEGCNLDPVFCELYDSSEEPQQIVPEELGDNRAYRGCEVVDAVNGIVKCYEGGPRSRYQIENLLRDACWEETTKECNCDEVPETDECVVDADCGPCATCEERQFRNDACCGIYGEGEITDSDGVPLPEGVDYIIRNICKGDPEKTSEECGCRSDLDCTECEYCEGGGPDAIGVCTPDCEVRCPCGGELTDGKECPSCQKRHGPCAKESSFDQGEPYVDPITGELVSPPSQCACVLDRSKECCKGFTSIAELKRQKTKCLLETTALADGTVQFIRTEKCLDPKQDICAQCETDAQCPGPQKCKGYQCISECGPGSSDPSNERTIDGQDLGDIGGDPYRCWCCAEDGSCRARYETWLESKGDPKGPWMIRYTFPGDSVSYRDYYSTQENYQAALNEVKAAWPGKKIEVYSADGEEQQSECRPCTCTGTGIQCGAWIDCQSCFTWEKRGGGSDLMPPAEVMRLEGKLGEAEAAYQSAQEAEDEALIDLETAEGEYNAAKNQAAINHSYQESASNYLSELRNQYYEQQRDLEEDIAEKEIAIKGLEARIEVAEYNEKESDLELLQAQLTEQQNQLAILEASLEETKTNLKENSDEIKELLTDLPNDVQIDLDTKAEQYDAAWDSVIKYRKLKNQHAQKIKDIQNDINKVQNPDSVYYEQVRQCDCCMEGVCRDESECTYGTCYLCVSEYDNTPGLAYNASLYGKVLKNRIYPESPDRTGEEDMRGIFRHDYLFEQDSCVKYDCGQTLYSEQRSGNNYQNRYWEYCIGSLLGCINKFYEGQQYQQGWVYEFDLSEAGTYFTTDFENWVKMGKYKGNKWPQTAYCLHDNSAAGALGFNTMVTFEDLVAGHPICNKAEVTFGCLPGNEGCGATFDTYFEAGAPDLVILRMKRELAELDALLAWLEGYDEFIDDFIVDKGKEKAALLEEQERLEDLVDSAKQDYEYWVNEVARLEALFNSSDDDRPDLEAEIEEKLEAFNEADAAVAEKYADTQQAQTDVDALNLEKEVAEGNLFTARAAANDQYLALNAVKGELAAKRDYLTTLDPLSAEYAITQTEIVNLEIEEAEAQNLYSNTVGDILSYEEQIKQITRYLEWNSCELESEYTDAEYEKKGRGECISYEQKLEDAKEEEEKVRKEWATAEQELREARTAFNEFVDNREVTFEELQSARQSKENAQFRYEDLAKKVGAEYYDPKLCPEGYTLKFRWNGGSFNGELVGYDICCLVKADGTANCADGVWKSPGQMTRDCLEICEQIINIEEQVASAMAVKKEINNLSEDSQQQRDAKKAEIDALVEKDENSTPPYAIGPVQRPDGSKSYEELVEEFEANVELDEFLAEQETWPPGRA